MVLVAVDESLLANDIKLLIGMSVFERCTVLVCVTNLFDLPVN